MNIVNQIYRTPRGLYEGGWVIKDTIKISLSDIKTLIDKEDKDIKENIYTFFISFIFSEIFHIMNIYLLIEVDVDLSLTFCIVPNINLAQNLDLS